MCETNETNEKSWNDEKIKNRVNEQERKWIFVVIVSEVEEKTVREAARNEEEKKTQQQNFRK